MGHQDIKVIRCLLGKLSSIISAPDPINKGFPDHPSTEFISLCSPGIPLAKKDLDFGDFSTWAQVRAHAFFSRIANGTPQPHEFYTITGKQIWDVYEHALFDIELPLSNSCNQTKFEGAFEEKARDSKILSAQLIQSSPLSDLEEDELYFRYRMSLLKYNNSIIESKSADSDQKTSEDLKLEKEKYRKELISAFHRLAQRNSELNITSLHQKNSLNVDRSPQEFYERLKSKFENARKSYTETYYNTTYFPMNVLEPEYDDCWAKFKFNYNDAIKSEPELMEKEGNFGDTSYSIWQVLNEEGAQRFQPLDSDNISISVELILIRILRPWFNDEIFRNKNWNWGSEWALDPISDGENPPNGQMPLIPTSIILARNLELILDDKNENIQSALDSIQSNKIIGWGPFALEGPLSEVTCACDDSNSKSSILRIKGVQIIGFICNSVPKSPDPDPDLNWPSTRRIINQNLQGDWSWEDGLGNKGAMIIEQSGEAIKGRYWYENRPHDLGLLSGIVTGNCLTGHYKSERFEGDVTWAVENKDKLSGRTSWGTTWNANKIHYIDPQGDWTWEDSLGDKGAMTIKQSGWEIKGNYWYDGSPKVYAISGIVVGNWITAHYDSKWFGGYITWTAEKSGKLLGKTSWGVIWNASKRK